MHLNERKINIFRSHMEGVRVLSRFTVGASWSGGEGEEEGLDGSKLMFVPHASWR